MHYAIISHLVIKLWYLKIYCDVRLLTYYGLFDPHFPEISHGCSEINVRMSYLMEKPHNNYKKRD